MPIKLHTCCAFDVAQHNEAGGIRRPFVSFPNKCLVTSRKRETLRAILGHLKLSDPQNICQVYINPLWEENVKKLGSYHSKSQVLGLQKPNLDWKSAREAFFKGLKVNFLSDKTPIFFYILRS